MKQLLIFLAAFFLIWNLHAQLPGYSFSTVSGTYTEIAGGTALGNETTDEQRFVDPTIPLGGTTTTGVGLPIGFNFEFSGSTFNVFAVNANGWISFGNSSNTPAVNMNSTSSYTSLSSTVSISPDELVSRVALFGRDLQSQTGGEIRYETIGTAPNRVLVVQWKGYKKYGTTGTGDNYNGQIRLYETTNVVELVYGTITNNATSTTVHVGLRGAPSATASNFASRTTTTDWLMTTASVAATEAVTISNLIFPPSGLTFVWTPPTCFAPIALTVSNLGQTSADLGWAGPANAVSWNVEVHTPGNSPGNGTPVASVTGHPTNTWTATGLSPVTLYNFYVQAHCGGTDYSIWQGPVQFQTTAAPLSGFYTINSTQPTGGTNFISFTDFATAMNLGGFAGPVTVDVVAGTGPYAEQVIFNEFPNSSATNTLTVNGNGETLQFLSTNTNERATLKFNGTDYVTVNNLIVKALGSVTTTPAEYGWAVWLTNNADYNSFSNCEFHASTTATATNFAGFVTSSSATGATTAGVAASYLTIDGCKAIGGYYGMVINGPTSAPYADNNTITNNEVTDFNLYGIYLRGLNNSLIADNLISRPTRTSTGILYMLYITQDMTGSSVVNNIINNFSPSIASTSTAHGIYGTGITATSGNELLIANNVIYGLENMNGTQYGMYMLTTDNTRFYHNTISLDNVAQSGSSLIRGFHHSGNLSTVDFRNNIISVTSNSSGIKFCMYFAQTTANIPNLTSDNNVLYMGATLGTNHYVYWTGDAGTNYSTLAAWQSAGGGLYDQNSVDVSPIFNTPLLTPTNGVINDIGANLLSIVPDDIFGMPRTPTPDPGAIEFDPPACAMPYALTATNITDVSAVLGWTPGGTEAEWNVEVHTPGNSPGTGTPVVSVTGTTTNPWTATGMTQLTNYVFFVQADCGSSNSDWAGPFAFATGLPPLSGYYTINSTQPTAGINFNSFTDFADALNLGGLAGAVTAEVIAGTGPYTEQIILGVIANSSAVNTITINGNGDTLQYLSTNTNERATLKLNGTDYMTVNNLIIKSLGTTTTEYGFAVQLMNGADYNTFYNCQFIADIATTSTQYAPFVTSNSATSAVTAGLAASNLTVTNCKAIGGYYGMVINGPTTAPFATGNVIMNNEIVDFHLYGLYLRGNNSGLFTGNQVSRPTRTTTGILYMIYLTSDMSSSLLDKNVVSGITAAATTSTAYGIYATTLVAQTGQPLLIANNVVYGFQNVNATQYGIYLGTTAALGNVQVYHNSISLDNVNQTGTSLIYCFYHTGATANLDIRNNLFSYTSNSTGAKYNLYFATNTAVVTSNFNVLHRGATAGTTNRTGYWSATFYETLGDWQAVVGQAFDIQSVDADPLFVTPLLTPINSAVNNIGTNLLSVIPDDIFDIPRTPNPDPGAIEFEPVSADIGLLSAELVKTGPCLNNNDSIYFTIRNILGNPLDFAVTPLTVYWTVNGPVNTTGSTTISSGMLAQGNNVTFGGDGVNMSLPGAYTISHAYILPGNENYIQTNDTLINAYVLNVPDLVFDAQPDYTLVTSSVDVVALTVSSNVLPVQGSFFITEVCTYRGSSTGAPAGGWPSYMIADDYIEVTGIPGFDLGGFTLEIWTSTALSGSQILAPGTIIGSNGTCVIAVGQLSTSAPSPANYYYHSGHTATLSSTTTYGFIFKDSNGSIVDAVGYGAYTFPAAANVTPADWSGNTPALSSAGNRLVGPYTKDATNWINSGVSPQDPNSVNPGVTVPSPVGLQDFTWSLNGVVTSYNNPDTIVGPWTVNGIYNYIATYTNACGAFTDTAVVEVFVPQSDLAILEIISPLEEVCYDAAEPVTIALTNFGTTAINTPFTASYIINGGTPVTETVNLLIGPADTVLYTFTTPISFVLTEDTTFNLIVYVSLPGDPFQFNDTMYVNRTFYFVPPAPVGVNDTIAVGGTANLQALSPYTVNWYASPTDQTVLHTGNTYTTPVLFTTTSFYASASAGTATQYVGPVNNTIGATSASTITTAQHTKFSVLNPSGITIQSFDIYFTGALGSAFTIQIQNSTGTGIMSYSGQVNVTGGAAQTVNVDFTVPFGQDYRILFTTNPGAQRNTTGAVYPYTLPGQISITGNTFDPVYYYFFYNWAIGSGSGCESGRTEILAVVGTTSCFPVTSMNVSNITATTADLSWIPGGTEDTWEIELGLEGFIPSQIATHTVNVNPNTTLAGLNYATDYEFYIRAFCDPDYSIWTGPYSFSTPCGVLIAPFVEDFEIIPPLCWSVYSITTQNWAISPNASGYGIGSNSAIAQFYSYPDEIPFYLITPEFDASALTSPVLKFDFAYAAYSGEIDELSIYYSTDGGASLFLLQNMQGGPTGSLNTGGTTTSSFIPTAAQWNSIEIALPAGTNLIVFEALSDYGNNLYIDNVAVQEAGISCVDFEEVTTAEICFGDIFSWRGNDYFLSGTYYDSLFTTNPPGCDSVYVLVLTAYPLPVVSITGLGSFYCDYYDAVTMTGIPAGGTFTGNGVTGSIFDPAAAGLGTWDVVYTFTDVNGCTNSHTVTVTIDECLSIGDYQNGDFIVYPNPVNDLLTVEIYVYDATQHIWNIYDMNGKLIISGEHALVSGKNAITVETAHLTSGLYMLQSNMNGMMRSVRIIKQ
jgi:parallel beta-helix repeat protein